MNRNELHDALMGVDEQYLAHSSDFKAVSASFRRRRARKIGAAASVMGCAAVALLAASFGNLGKYKSQMLADSVVEAAFSAGENTPASTVPNAENVIATSSMMTTAVSVTENLAASTLAITTQSNVSYPAVSKPETPNEIVWQVTKLDGCENITTAIAMFPEDSLFIKNYCFGSKYEIGTADCLNDYCFRMETGETIYYHSCCGTFNDTANERSYHVSDSMRDEINAILDKYFLIIGTSE